MNGRISSGINGLDPLINGGYVSNSINLVTGGAGAGKTIFLAHFLYDGALKNEKGLFISFEQDVISVKKDLESFGFNFDKLENRGLIKFIYMGPYKQKDLQAEILKEISKFKASRVAIDSLSVFAMSFKDEYEVEECIADSVITLHNAGMGGEADRALRIVKMRRTAHARGVVPMQITNKGIVVKK